jgi:hypothetical protein
VTSAKLRHSARALHWRQTALAASICATAIPVEPVGKKSSGTVPRQDASSRQPAFPADVRLLVMTDAARLRLRRPPNGIHNYNRNDAWAGEYTDNRAANASRVGSRQVGLGERTIQPVPSTQPTSPYTRDGEISHQPGTEEDILPGGCLLNLWLLTKPPVLYHPNELRDGEIAR